MSTAFDAIEIVRASNQNLDTISLSIPRGLITILSGPSACGKTALAIHTLGAESRYRLSVLNDNKNENAERPAVDKISRLSPCLVLPAFKGARLSDSIASFMGAGSILGSLARRAGKLFCPKCKSEIIQGNQDDGLEAIYGIASEKTVAVVSSLYKKPAHTNKNSSTSLIKEIDRLVSQGFFRLIINQDEIRLDGSDLSWRLLLTQESSFGSIETIGIVVDRLSVNESNRSRLAQSIESAAKISRAGISIYEIKNQSSPLKLFMNLNRGASCQRCGYESLILSQNLFDFGFKKTGRGFLGLGDISAEHRDEFFKVSILSKSIEQILDGHFSVLHTWITKLPDSPECTALRSIVDIMIELGLEDLSFARKTSSLSSGEWQRLKLAQLLSRRLEGIMYIFDMPSLYLHPQERVRVAQSLAKFHSSIPKDSSPTILIVDNCPELRRIAMFEIQLGIGPGPLGGKVIYSGPPKQNKPLPISHRPSSESVSVPARLVFSSTGHLDNAPFKFSVPMRGLTVIDGLSGSGKTVLMFERLLPAVSAWLAENKRRAPAAKVKKPIFDSCTTHLTIEGFGIIKHVASLSSATQSTRSQTTVGQQIGIFDLLTKLFAMLPVAKQRGYTSKTFTTQKSGTFSPELLEVRFKGYSIAEILRLNVAEASEIFTNIPGSKSIWQAMQQLNLEYLPLNRKIRGLSTSEQQRMRLLPILQRTSSDNIYFLDYPCVGFDEELAAKVARVLRNLVDGGNTVIAIDHSPELARQSDYVLKLPLGVKPCLQDKPQG